MNSRNRDGIQGSGAAIPGHPPRHARGADPCDLLLLELEPRTSFGPTNYGHLQVFEIVDLHLSARLVVLSACETGLAAGAYSNTPPGEEFTGLTQAFLTAGSRTVLASLWSISDLCHRLGDAAVDLNDRASRRRGRR